MIDNNKSVVLAASERAAMAGLMRSQGISIQKLARRSNRTIPAVSRVLSGEPVVGWTAKRVRASLVRSPGTCDPYEYGRELYLACAERLK